MSQPLIVLGDKTSHGGTVLTASPFSDTHGKGWARIGDQVSCPKCGGIFPIIEGDGSLIDDGKAVAYHGCKVACGATLIASQNFSFTTPSGGSGGSSESEALAEGLGLIGSNLIAGYQDEQLSDTRRFRGRFQVIDQATGEPIPGVAFRVRSTGGQYITGTTDSEVKWTHQSRQSAG